MNSKFIENQIGYVKDYSKVNSFCKDNERFRIEYEIK